MEEPDSPIAMRSSPPSIGGMGGSGGERLARGQVRGRFHI
jgi:hypothetical protein